MMKKINKTLAPALIFLMSFNPQLSYAQNSTELGEVNTFGEFVSLIWAFGSRVIIGMAVFFIILGAIYYIASGGSEEKITEGKQMIFGSVGAIFIVLLSGVLIRLLHQPSSGTTGSLSDIPAVISNASNILVGLIGGFSFLMLAYAGILYLTGRGQKDRLTKAHRAFAYAIYGLIIGLLAFALANLLIKFLV